VAHAFDDGFAARSHMHRHLDVAVQRAGREACQGGVQLPQIIDRDHFGTRLPEGARHLGHPF